MDKKKRGASTIEYVALLIMIMTALIVFRDYIIRGVAGRIKAVGDTFGSERQYDPRPYGVHGEGGGTLSCVYHRDTGEWLEADCYDRCLPLGCLSTCNHPDCD